MIVLSLLLLAVGIGLSVSGWSGLSRSESTTVALLGGVAAVAVIGGLFLGRSLVGLLAAAAFVAVAAGMSVHAQGRLEDSARRGTPTAKVVVISAGIGALPGILVVAGSWLLAATEVITADQSQAGFIGIPLAVAGGLIGGAVGVVVGGPSETHDDANQR